MNSSLRISPGGIGFSCFLLITSLRTECNVRVDGVPNGEGGEAYGVCDPNQGY